MLSTVSSEPETMLSSTIFIATVLVPSASVPSRCRDVMTCLVIAILLSLAWLEARASWIYDVETKSWSG